MKMSILTIILTLFTLRAFCPTTGEVCIPEGEAIMPYERIINAVVAVESSGNTFAYNPKEGAVGSFQIRQIRIDEYNRLSGENLKLTDCYDYEVSKRVFLYYSVKFRYDDYKSISKDWNKSRTDKYWNRVKAKLN